MILFVLLLCVIFLCIRVLQRVYFLYAGHRSSWYSPRKELKDLLISYRVPVESFQIKSSIDHVPLRFQKIGTGKAVFFLANGVGTDTFIFFDVIRIMLSLDPNLFQKISLYTSSFRGLFEPPEDSPEVKITVANCAQDIEDILQAMQIPVLDGIIGWSTGAQIGLYLLLKRPTLIKSYFLLNPTNGLTLHTALQPFCPLPTFLGRQVGYYMNALFRYLVKLVYTHVWDTLKVFNDSIYFYIVLSIFAFFGGFPPDQPIYFHEYMLDAFRSRRHTKHLLQLILSLDDHTIDIAKDDVRKALAESTQCFVIISGMTDFLTGVYHSHRLIDWLTDYGKRVKSIRHVSFTMGSHFILIEWPEMVAKELVKFFLVSKSIQS
jgi:pimeloyl-ACP methyl ester carboxylesterase